MTFEPQFSSSKPWFVSILLFFLVSKLFSEKAFRLKFQDWVEDDDRIRVRSWYAEGGTSLSNGWEVGVVGMVDTITGSTPWGIPPTEDEWLKPLEDERTAGLISLSKKYQDYQFSFEYGLSDESDYLSRSYAAGISRGFAEDTLIVSAGYSYLDDEVDTSPTGLRGFGIQARRTPEIFLGIERILDPQTTLAFNLTYGRPEGYLSDPYKVIGLVYTLFAGEPNEMQLMDSHPENRPNERETFAAYFEGVHMFKDLDASAEASYRFFADDSDLSGHTFEFQWLQRIGDKFVLRPLLRHYIQNQADFYYVTLDGTGITPPTPSPPTGSAPFYSSDYRLSEFKANTYGLKLTYFHRSDLSFDLSYDRYAVMGTDGQTDQRVYPDAGVLTLGFQWGF